MSELSRNFWIEFVVSVLVIGSIAVAIIASESQPLNKHDIKFTAGDLRSFSAAGRQLFAQHQDGQLTETFFATQVQLLDEKVVSARQTLVYSDAEPNAKQAQRIAGDLAAQLEAAINELESSPQSGPLTAERLSDLESKAKGLEESLSNE